MGIHTANQRDSALEKLALRKRCLALRAGISPEISRKKSEKICEGIAEHLKQGPFTQLFLFAPMRFEVDVLLLKYDVEHVGLPRIAKKPLMEFFQWQGEELKVNTFGIREPIGECQLKADANTLIVVPALAASLDGMRLGYGGGYYDRYLQDHPLARSLIVIFSELLMENGSIPIDPWDKKADGVLWA